MYRVSIKLYKHERKFGRTRNTREQEPQASVSTAFLSSAKLSGCLENADLENTDLENADLENTDLENTDHENADLENAGRKIKNAACILDWKASLFYKINEKKKI